MKIGEKVVFSVNGTWGIESDYVPTDAFASGKNWKAAKNELRRSVNSGEAKLEESQPENSFHTTVYDIIVDNNQ